MRNLPRQKYLAIVLASLLFMYNTSKACENGKVCTNSKSLACPALEIDNLTPLGNDCNLTPAPLATVTIQYNSCMAGLCDGVIDYLVEITTPNGNHVYHQYITSNLVSTFSPCYVVPTPFPTGCTSYTVRATMRCDGNVMTSPGMLYQNTAEVCM